MKTYEETLKEVAKKVWNDEMGGGQGRIEVGMIPFIFEKSEDSVFKDIKTAVKTFDSEFRKGQ